MDNTQQLPDEVVQNIYTRANDLAIDNMDLGYLPSDRIILSIRDRLVTIATEYATKLLQVQLENESLTNQLKNHSKASDENMKLLRQENEKARTLLEKVMSSDSFPKLKDYELSIEIKTFLDGK